MTFVGILLTAWLFINLNSIFTRPLAERYGIVEFKGLKKRGVKNGRLLYFFYLCLIGIAFGLVVAPLSWLGMEYRESALILAVYPYLMAFLMAVHAMFELLAGVCVFLGSQSRPTRYVVHKGIRQVGWRRLWWNGITAVLLSLFWVWQGLKLGEPSIGVTRWVGLVLLLGVILALYMLPRLSRRGQRRLRRWLRKVPWVGESMK